MRIRILLLSVIFFQFHLSFCRDSYEELLITTLSNDYFVSGETVYFSLFCLEKENQQFSKVSSIAYVTLLNEKKQVVENIKVKLSNGRGNGEFFVKSQYPTGNYYIFAHTALMLNQPTSDIQGSKLAIVNPFMGYKNPQQPETIETNRSETFPKTSEKEEKGVIEISNIETSYKVRSRVKFDIRTESKSYLSVTVRLLDSLSGQPDERKNAKRYLSNSSIQSNAKPYKWLPDTKGELVRGVVKNISDSTDFPISIYAVFPGPKSRLFVDVLHAGSDTFLITLPTAYLGDKYLLQSPECQSCQFHPFDKFLPNYDFVETRPLLLSENQLSRISSRSIKSQIENAYFEEKRPNGVNGNYQPFFGQPSYSYNLSDYTKFNRMEDIFKEVTSTISLRSNRDQYQLKVIGGGEVLENPLIMIDGIVSKENAVMSLDPGVIQSIDVVTNAFHLNEMRFEGIISIKTSRSLNELFQLNNHNVFDFIPVDEPAKRASLIENKRRIPEYSHILYWNPHLEVNHKGKSIELQTGDSKGTYLISVFGIDSDSNLIESSWKFDVH